MSKQCKKFSMSHVLLNYFSVSFWCHSVSRDFSSWNIILNRLHRKNVKHVSFVWYYVEREESITKLYSSSSSHSFMHFLAFLINTALGNNWLWLEKWGRHDLNLCYHQNSVWRKTSTHRHSAERPYQLQIRSL